jgi:hypothetical protein
MTHRSQRIITVTLVVGLIIAVGVIDTLFALGRPSRLGVCPGSGAIFPGTT